MLGTLDLGISPEELREQVVGRAAERVADYVISRAEGEAESAITAAINEQVTAAIDKVVAEAVRPLAEGGVEALVMTQTNEWGEAKGQPLTFREYAVKRAEEYMTEPVNHEGKNRKEARNSYGWNATGMRVTHMVHEHLHYEIERAMKAALQDANNKIAAGIQDTVKLKLDEVRDALKVEMKSGRR